jgi:hypothetical protein
MRSLRRDRPPALAAVLLAVALSACIGPAPSLKASRVATISGRETAGLNSVDATRKALLDAAKLTVDHGFRYFMIIRTSNPPIGHSGPGTSRAQSIPALSSAASILAPGTDITIKTFRVGEVGRNRAGIWDAYQLLTSGVEGTGVARK